MKVNIPAILLITVFFFLAGCGDTGQPRLTIEEYYSPQCESCVETDGIVAEMEKKYGKKILVSRINLDTDEGTKLGREMQIKTIPVFVFTDRDGIEFSRHTGKIGKEDLEKIIKSKL